MSSDYEARITEAIRMVGEGVLTIEAAKGMRIVPSTLSRRLRETNPTKPRHEAHQYRQRLSQEQEEFLEEWILHEELCGRAPTKACVRGFAECIIEAGGDTTPLGTTWINRFLNRHNNLRTKVGRVISADRFDAMNYNNCKTFYRYYYRVIGHYDIPPRDRSNMDEAGVQEGEQGGGTVIGHSGSYRARIKKSVVTSWVTFIECIRATGGKLITTFIFSGLTV
jgi:hypothetical protein